MLVPLLLGCTQPESDSATAAVDSAEPVADTGPEPLTPDEVVAQLDAFFAIGLPSPIAIRTAWLDTLAHGDESCPGSGSQILTPPEGCVTEEGYWFSGLATLEDDLEPNGTVTVWSLSGEFEVIDDEGQVFGAGGSAGAAYEGSGQAAFIGTSVSGTWRQDDGAPFLAAGFSGHFLASMNRQGEGVTILLDGAVSYGGEIVVSFSEAKVESASCPESLTGSMQIRDALGRWYQVELACGGCGMVSLDGEELGEGCMTTEGIPELIGQTLEAEL